jgi:hypothetical protein
MEERYEVKRRRGVEMEGRAPSPPNSHGSGGSDDEEQRLWKRKKEKN